MLLDLLLNRGTRTALSAAALAGAGVVGSQYLAPKAPDAAALQVLHQGGDAAPLEVTPLASTGGGPVIREIRAEEPAGPTPPAPAAAVPPGAATAPASAWQASSGIDWSPMLAGPISESGRSAPQIGQELRSLLGNLGAGGQGLEGAGDALQAKLQRLLNNGIRQYSMEFILHCLSDYKDPTCAGLWADVEALQREVVDGAQLGTGQDPR